MACLEWGSAGVVTLKFIFAGTLILVASHTIYVDMGSNCTSGKRGISLYTRF